MTLREWAKYRLDAIERSPFGWGTAEGIQMAYWNHLEMALFDESDMKEVTEKVRKAVLTAIYHHFGPGPKVLWNRVGNSDEDIAKVIDCLKDARKELLPPIEEEP